MLVRWRSETAGSYCLFELEQLDFEIQGRLRRDRALQTGFPIGELVRDDELVSGSAVSPQGQVNYS